MKYEVKRACGCVEIIDIFGTNVHGERDKKAAWYAQTKCAHCNAKEDNENCKEIEMHYSEYKNNYAECKTVPNSYDTKTKTIVVFVPVEEQNEEITEEYMEK